jgi:hypothetical protein
LLVADAPPLRDVVKDCTAIRDSSVDATSPAIIESASSLRFYERKSEIKVSLLSKSRTHGKREANFERRNAHKQPALLSINYDERPPGGVKKSSSLPHPTRHPPHSTCKANSNHQSVFVNNSEEKTRVARTEVAFLSGHERSGDALSWPDASPK